MWLISVVVNIILTPISYDLPLLGYGISWFIIFIVSLVATILFQCKYKYSGTSENEEELQRCVSHSVLVISYPSLIASILYKIIVFGGSYLGLF